MACQYSFKSSAISGYELATWHYEKNKCDKLRIWKYEEEIHNYSIRDPPHVTKYSAVFLELKHWLYVVQKTDEIKKYLGIVRLVTQDLCVYIWLVMALFNIFQKCIAQIYRICTSQRKKRRTNWRPVHKFYSSRVKGGTQNDPRSRRRHKTQMEFQHPLC